MTSNMALIRRREPVYDSAYVTGFQRRWPNQGRPSQRRCQLMNLGMRNQKKKKLFNSIAGHKIQVAPLINHVQDTDDWIYDTIAV